jgi:ABC-type transport system involved in multi-copper enzyme maturation permease subunit
MTINPNELNQVSEEIEEMVTRPVLFDNEVQTGTIPREFQEKFSQKEWIIRTLRRFWVLFQKDVKKRFSSINNALFICFNIALISILYESFIRMIDPTPLMKTNMIKEVFNGNSIMTLLLFSFIITYDLFSSEFTKKTIIYVAIAPIKKSLYILSRILASLAVFTIEFFLILIIFFLFFGVPFDFAFIMNTVINYFILIGFFLILLMFFSVLTRHALLPTVFYGVLLITSETISNEFMKSHPNDYTFSIIYHIGKIGEYFNESFIVWPHRFSTGLWSELLPFIIASILLFAGTTFILNHIDLKG